MPVVVVSEGATDVGDFLSDGREGSVRILVRRLISEKVGVQLPPDRVVRGNWARVQKENMKSADGYRIKLAKTIAVYQATGDCEGLAVVVDRDKPRHSDRLTELQAGREEAHSAGVALAERTAVGMAVEEVEAWLLGDHDLLTHTFGRKKGIPTPEELTNPKEKYQEVLTELKYDPRECYDTIAKDASLKNIREKCPSFEAFATDVEQRIEIEP